MDALKEKICPKCNTKNPQVANYCRHCGAKFNMMPTISDFRVEKNCHAGEYAVLSWKISNADKVTLNGYDVTEMEKCCIYITQDMYCILNATKGGNSTSRTILIHPENDRCVNEKYGHIIKTEKKNPNTAIALGRIMHGLLNRKIKNT